RLAPEPQILSASQQLPGRAYRRSLQNARMGEGRSLPALSHFNAQPPSATGTGSIGRPPGPSSKVVQPLAGTCETPFFVQSQTPVGKTAASRACWSAVNVTPA